MGYAAHRTDSPETRGASLSEADLVVGHLVAARGDALAHLREELPLGLRLARELDEGGLERVERQVDVGVPGEGREGGGGVKGKRGNIARL